MKNTFFYGPFKPLVIAMTVFPCVAFSATWNVDTVTELRNAMANASNGDTIVVASGTYQPSSSLNTNTLSQSNGGANRVVAPQFMLLNKSNVTIKGASSTNRPVLKGTGITDGKYVFYAQKANGLVLKDIVFKDSTKGVIIDRSDNVVVNNIRVENIGNEGLHFRDGSDNGETKYSEFYKIGMDRKDRGEAIYICNDKKKWHSNYTTTSDDIYQENCDNHHIHNNAFLGEIGAEHIDIKEGTRGHNIHDNTFTAKITNSTLINSTGDFAKSIVHDKGYNNRIHNNTFNMANMKWYGVGEWAAIRVEQVLNDGEYGANLYGHNGGYVHNNLTNSNSGSSSEFVVLGPSDGADNAKVGCDTINGSNDKYRVLSQSKSGLEIDGGVGNTGASVVSGAACDNYAPGAGGSSSGQTYSKVLDVFKDAHVRDGSYANTNYGTSQSLTIKKSNTNGYSREFFIGFDRSAIGNGGDKNIVKATLRFKMKTVNTTAQNYLTEVRGVDNSWSELGVTWNTKPAFKAVAATFYPAADEQWVNIDVTDYVKNDTDKSRTLFHLTGASTDSQSNWSAYSRESAFPPELILEWQ